jgi:DNA-directed RNA polymerase subunit RPC12/RpoP
VAAHRLEVIPKPAEGTRSVLVTDRTDDDFFYMTGEFTDDSYECGSCGRPLVRGVRPGTLQDIVLRCPRCGSYNDT